MKAHIVFPTLDYKLFDARIGDQSDIPNFSDPVMLCTSMSKMSGVEGHSQPAQRPPFLLRPAEKLMATVVCEDMALAGSPWKAAKYGSRLGSRCQRPSLAQVLSSGGEPRTAN
jgi:hypothetical protein